VGVDMWVMIVVSKHDKDFRRSQLSIVFVLLVEKPPLFPNMIKTHNRSTKDIHGCGYPYDSSLFNCSTVVFRETSSDIFSAIF
jgi:hypothetical protein